MKIVLCNPEVRQEYSHSRKGMYPPIGMMSLATRLEMDYPDDVKVKIIDEDVDPISIDEFNNADFVGFHTNTMNYENCLRFAKEAKKRGARVILGGPHSTVLWKNIMQNRDYIDFIIINEGEIPLSLLVGRYLGTNNILLNDIPNLVYRDGDSGNKGFEVSCRSYINKAEDMIIPSRKYIESEKYISNSRKIYKESETPFRRPFSIYSSKGCTWRDRSGGCVFCARLEKGVRFRNINDIWQEVQMLRKDYNADNIWDISDDNLNNEKWFIDLVESKPRDLGDLTFFIYSRVNLINDRIIEYMKKLNVLEVYLGFETGDDRMLKKALKGSSAKVGLMAAKKLKESNIRYFPSFVLGLPEEDETSLKNTYEYVQEIYNIGGIYRLAASILMPIPGSKVFDTLLEDREGQEFLEGSDIIDIKKLEKLWVKNYTNVDYETLQEYQKKILEIGQTKTFGIRVD